jgi:ATP-dependent DNA helicase RecG
MTAENQSMDKKSLRYILEKHHDAEHLACDCVGFANALGGKIMLGIEDDSDTPPPDQRIRDTIPGQLRKRLSQITVNVGIEIRKIAASNGGEFLEIQIFRNEQNIASTSDGRYFLRVSDETKRLLPDDLGRLWNDRNSFVWELQIQRRLTADRADPQKQESLCRHIRASDRVSDFIKNKSDAELLQYYLLIQEGCLTNLGMLWIGKREDRAALLHAPVIQCLKYDESGQKVRKWLWDDYSLNPMELIEAVWREVPEWQESYELPDGLFRKNVPHYDEVIIRELLANALVHRPYTMRGDIFINLYPDRLEVHNPGLLPIGVTTENILHVSIQRNPHLAKVFYDLKIMEREGSGFDRMYQVLLSSGRPAPEVQEGDDRVVVIVRKKIVSPEIVDFMFRVEKEFQPTQKEIIALGILAQSESLTGAQLSRELELENAEQLAPWVERLKKWKLVTLYGRTSGAEYQVSPAVLRKMNFKGKTSLKRIQDPRLRELVLQDLSIYVRASRSEIHERIGTEIAESKLRRILYQLVKEGILKVEGENRWRKYLLISKDSDSPDSAQ